MLLLLLLFLLKPDITAANSSVMPLIPETPTDVSQDESRDLAEESGRKGERRARSRGVRVNQNSSRQPGQIDRGDEPMLGPDKVTNHEPPAPSQLEKTMSLLDFTMLRAKNYTSVSVVNKKKNYNCEFCGFVTPLFNTLKVHVKKNHLEIPNKNVSVGGVGEKRGLSEDSILNVTRKSCTRYRIIFFI